jgi:hypothetical protein
MSTRSGFDLSGPYCDFSHAALNCLPGRQHEDWGSTGTLRGMARRGGDKPEDREMHVRPFYPTPVKITSVVRALDERKLCCTTHVAESVPVTTFSRLQTHEAFVFHVSFFLMRYQL